MTSFVGFVAMKPADKSRALTNPEVAKEIAAQLPTATQSQIENIGEYLGIIARSSTRLFEGAVAQWDIEAVYPALEKTLGASKNLNTQKNLAVAIGSALKFKFTEKKNAFEKFLNLNKELAPEVSGAVASVCGKKIFKLLNLPKETEPIAAASPEKKNNKRSAPEVSSAASTPNTVPSKMPAQQLAEDATRPIPAAAVAAAAAASAGAPVCKLSDVKFTDMELTAPTRDALANVFKFEYMTPVQAATLPDVQAGNDVLAKARTGTGKTLAFLVPQANRIFKASTSTQQDAISVLVIAPTRELALQIEAEGSKLFTYQKNVVVASVIGGRKMTSESRVLRGRVDVLVATPGRLIDHLQSDRQFADRIGRTLKTLVFDECDQLMDMGFVRDLDRIVSYLPPKDTRQTLLYSATVPELILTLASKYCRAGFKHIDCVGEEAATHSHVSQTYAVVPFAQQLQVLFYLLSKQTRNKSIVFFQTARGAQLAAEVFEKSPLVKTHDVFEIHSRKSQAQRTKAQNGFASSPLTRPAVLFSSDASARGVDYPGVELVVQVGAPTDKQQYIHRLGRTARAGNEGTGVLIVDQCEGWMYKDILADQTIELKENTDLTSILTGKKTDAVFSSAGDLVNTAMKKVSPATKECAYQAWLGYFNTFCSRMKWSKDRLVGEANAYAQNVLFYSSFDENGDWQPPALRRDTVGKMNLKGVEGLNIEGGAAGGRGQRAPGGGRGGRPDLFGAGFRDGNSNNNGGGNQQRGEGGNGRGGFGGGRGGRGGFGGGRGGRQ